MNEVEMTVKFTPKQIEEAIRKHFELPANAVVHFELKDEGGGHCEKFGYSKGYKVFSHAKAKFKKSLKEVLK